LLFAIRCKNSAGPEEVSYSLAEDEFVRVLSPNGGETIPYGSSLTITWLMRVDVREIENANVPLNILSSYPFNHGGEYEDISFRAKWPKR